MKYVSTRGASSAVPFREAVTLGQANDGGLLMPNEIPNVVERNNSWRKLSFADLAIEIAALYAPDIPRDQMSRLMYGSFSTFSSPQVVPLRELNDCFILELFHGPTLAFKDIALQVLGRLFELILEEDDSYLNILGATSGDTGSAAIAGVKDRKRLNIFVMFPEGRTSLLQELQMTTVQSSNTHCIGIRGSFDDCQRIMKSIFEDVQFKSRHRLGAVNSINWARLMVQVVYYYFASLKFNEPVSFSVPTGNFGNILSGMIAKKMGAPIERFILGTNENDVLFKFFNTGVYERGHVHPTLSPSMDIQVASNLERYVYLQMHGDSVALTRFMDSFSRTGRAKLDGHPENDETVRAKRIDTPQCLQTIKQVWQESGYLLDPHSAVGVAAARSVNLDPPIVCLATAHPVKFPDAISQATGGPPPSHPSLLELDQATARKKVLPSSEDSVRDYIEEILENS